MKLQSLVIRFLRFITNKLRIFTRYLDFLVCGLYKNTAISYAEKSVKENRKFVSMFPPALIVEMETALIIQEILKEDEKENN